MPNGTRDLKRENVIQPRHRRGFTLLEVIITIAVLGVLFGLGIMSFSQPRARLYSDQVASQIRQARIEAIKRNRPIAVTWDAATSRFLTRHDTANTTFANTCTGAEILAESASTEFGPVTVTHTLPNNGIVWLPNTLLRSCGGPAAGTVTISIDDSNDTRVISISSAGEVNVQ